MGPLRVKFSLSGTLFSWIIVYQSGEKAFIQICMKTHSFSSQKSVGISWFWPHHLFYLLQTEKYIYLYILFHFNLKIVQDSNWLLSSMSLLQSQPSCLKSPCPSHQEWLPPVTATSSSVFWYITLHGLHRFTIFKMTSFVCFLFIAWKHYLYLLEGEQTGSLFLYVHVLITTQQYFNCKHGF